MHLHVNRSNKQISHCDTHLKQLDQILMVSAGENSVWSVAFAPTDPDERVCVCYKKR